MNINVYLSDKDEHDQRLADQLRREAVKQDRSISHLMRTALEEYLARHPGNGHPQTTT